jgi:hypothetical protein
VTGFTAPERQIAEEASLLQALRQPAVLFLPLILLFDIKGANAAERDLGAG